MITLWHKGLALQVALLAAALSCGAAPGVRAADETDPIVVVDDAPAEAHLREAEAGAVEVVQVPAVPGAVDLADLLNQATGVQVDRLGGLGQFATVSIRGSASDQVAVYLDGVPLQRAAGGAVNLADLPLGQIERVEIWRGQAPRHLPGAPAGGAINLVTRHGGRGGGAAVTAGSFGTLVARADGRLSPGPLTVVGFADAQLSRGDFTFEDDNGTPLYTGDDALSRRLNNDLAQLSGHLRVSGATWRADVDALSADRGLSGVAAVQALLPRLTSQRLLASASFEPRWAGALVLKLNADTAATSDRFVDPEAELGLGPRDVTGVSRTAGGQLAATLVTSERWSAGLTAAPRLETYTQLEALPVLVSGDTSARRRLDVGVYADLNLRPGLWLSPALKAAGLLDDFADMDEVRRLLASPSLGLRLEAGRGFGLRASAWSGARAPSFFELFGDRGALLGNPALLPERVRGVEASTAWQPASTPVTLLEVGGYAKRADDLIQYVQNSQSTSRPVNISQALLLGAEGRIVIALAQGLRLTANATALSATDRGDDGYYSGLQLPRRPRWEAGLLCAWSPRRAPEVDVSADLNLASAVYLDRANLTPVDGQRLLGLQGSAPLGDGLSLSVRLSNLLGQQVPDFGGYPLPGRSAFVGLSWRG